MPEDFSSKTCLVFDHGFFLPLARRLAESFGRVLYYTPWEKGYPILNEGIIGAGFGDLIRCNDFWPLKKSIDLFVFPDIYHAGLQAELRSQGCRVWGAGAGMKLELDREFFLKKLDELGLAVAPHKRIVGLTALAEYLKDKTDQYIKVSLWRGSWETKHWRSWADDADKLDLWAVRLGGLKEHVPFLVFSEIKTKLEIGGDTYSVHGQWPAFMLHGIEKKDEAYFAAVTPRREMPEELTHILDSFAPFLAENRYAAQWSMEVRVTDDEAFFIDATTRGGLPSTASFLSAKNIPEVLYHGADGDLVEIDYGYKFSAECMVKIHGEPDAWASMILPPELDPWFKVSDCCQLDGKLWFPSDGNKPIEETGWLVALGDTPTEVARKMNELADQLPDGAEASVESLADILREITAEEEAGIKFTDQEIPPPEIVLETSTVGE
jgi:hypothetical protein